jgi:hypothetical protein
MTADENGNFHIQPNAEAFPDREERFLVAVVQALHAVQHYMTHVAMAREARGIAAVDLEEVQSATIDMEMGFARALQRRRRDLTAIARLSPEVRR